MHRYTLLLEKTPVLFDNFLCPLSDEIILVMSLSFLH